MTSVWAYIKTEPAILISLVGAIMAVALSFGLALSEAQTSAITGVVVIVVGLLTRTAVTPNSKVPELPPVVFSSDTAGPR